MGVLVTVHLAGDPDRLEAAYLRHRDEVWAGSAECLSHLVARMAGGLLIADEWAAESAFRSRYAGSGLAGAVREAGGAEEVRVATVIARRGEPTGARAEPGDTIDEADPSERLVPSDS